MEVPNYVTEPEEPPEDLEKKRKKPKLTKAQKAEIKMQKENEFKKLEIRVHLKTELELSRKTYEKYQERWEEMCKDARVAEFHQDLQTWMAKTDRVMFEKDEAIQTMIENIETTFETQKRVFNKNVECLDYITTTHDVMLKLHDDYYQSLCTTSLKDFLEEMHEQDYYLNELKINQENIIHAANMLVEEQMKTDYKNHLVKKYDIVDTEINYRFLIRDEVRSRMSDLYQQLTDFIDAVKSASLDTHKYERMSKLMVKQNNFVLEQRKLNVSETRNTTNLMDLNREVLRKEVERGRKLHNLRLELSYFLQVHKNIENSIETDRLRTFDLLKTLTNSSYDIIKKYKHLVKYGELLLALGADCRKLETQKSKIVPWGDHPEFYKVEEEDIENSFEIMALNLHKHLDLSEAEIQEQMKLLKNFWRRQALVEMENLLLIEYKRKLMEENEMYLNKLRAMDTAIDFSKLLGTLQVKQVAPLQAMACQKYRYITPRGGM